MLTNRANLNASVYFIDREINAAEYGAMLELSISPSTHQAIASMKAKYILSFVFHRSISVRFSRRIWAHVSRAA
jgi:hypothetical protein